MSEGIGSPCVTHWIQEEFQNVPPLSRLRMAAEACLSLLQQTLSPRWEARVSGLIARLDRALPS